MSTFTVLAGGGLASSSATYTPTGNPGAGDDVIFTAASGNVTLDTNQNWRSLDFSGSGVSAYTGTFTHNAAVTLTLGTTTTNGSLSLKMVAGMTYTLGSATTSAITFASTSGTQEQITSAGKTLGNVTFSGVGGSWILQDGFTNTGTVTLSHGTLNTNATTNTWSVFTDSGTATRALTLGASSITMNGAGTIFTIGSVTGLTLSAAGSTITFTGNANQINTPSATTFGTVIFSGLGVAQVNNGPTFANFTRTGTAAKTDALSFTGSPTITGTLTLNSNSSTNRLQVLSSVIGTARTITAASLVCTNAIDFMDITGAGAATWTTAASGGTFFGDCQGNSGITFTTSAAQTWSGNTTGNWSDVTKWTSRVPLPQDDVTISGLTSGTITTDMPRIGRSLDATGSTGVWNMTSNAVSIFGSLTIPAGMTGALNQTINLCGRTSGNTLGISGVSLTGGMNTLSPGGTYTLSANLGWVTSINAVGISFQYGTFTANGFNVTMGTGGFLNNNTKTLNMGSGTWTLMGQTGWVGQASGFGATLNAGTSTMVITGHNYGIGSYSFATGNQTYNNVTLTNTSWVGGVQTANITSAYTIGGAGTFNTLTVGAGVLLTMPASTTNTVTTLSATGQNYRYLYLPGVASEYASTPSTTALRITGDITLDAHVALPIWSSGNNQLIAKFGGTNPTTAYLLTVNAGTVRLTIGPAGGTGVTATSSASVSFANGAAGWVRASRVSSTGVVTFYTSPDGTTWTQLGTTSVLSAGVLITDASGQQVELGTQNNGAAALVMSFYEARIYNIALGSGAGTPVFDANFTTKAFGANSFTESSSNAATVTINGSLAQIGDGRIAIVSSTPGTQATIARTTGSVICDYLVLTDSKASGGTPFYAGTHGQLVSNNTNWSISGSMIPFC